MGAVVWKRGVECVDASYLGIQGDGSDVTTKLLAAVNGSDVPTGGRAITLDGAEYGIAPDALSWNRHNVVLQGPHSGNPFSSVAANSFPSIKCLTDGGFFIKIGDAANYAAGLGTLKYAPGLSGIHINGNGRKFTDAGIVMEGVTKPVFHNLLIQRFGENSSGRYTKTMRMRNVWDMREATNVMARHLYNPDAALFEFDDWVDSAAGNNNNIVFTHGHFEQFDGILFKSRANSNLDECGWFQSKFEMGSGIVTGTANYVFDLDGCQTAMIMQNHLNQFSSARFAALARIGATTVSLANISMFNTYQTVTCRDVDFGEFAALPEWFRNRQVNSASAMGMTNVSKYPVFYEPPASLTAAGTSGTDGVSFGARRSMIRSGVGWVSVHDLDPNIGTAFIGDTSSVSNEKSVYRVTTTAAGTVLFGLPQRLFRDCPVDVDVYVRAKKTTTGSTGALRLNINGVNLAPSTGSLADNINWQTAKFELTVSSHLAGLNTAVDSGDRFRLEYGTSNATVIDVDAVMFVKKTTAS